MIPLAVPNLTGNEKKYLDNCIDTTYVSSVGAYVTKFEEMVADATESTSAVATSSGTTGIHAALTAVGVRPGDLVIIPTFTFIATANAVRHCGADPWLMDITARDWCLNPVLVRNEIEEHCERKGDSQLYHKEKKQRVAALMPVYTLGNIPHMKEFRDIADEYGLPLVVDAACAIGATYEGKNFGTLADLSVLSFNGNKTITCGGGGAVVYNVSYPKAKKWGEKVRHITTTARVWPDYDFDEVGFNYRMTNIQAAVGVAQMERLKFFIDMKRSVRNFYEESLRPLTKMKVSFFPATEGSSCWFSGIILPEGTGFNTTKEICIKLKEDGIEVRPFWKPVHLQKPYKDCLKSTVEVAESLWQRIITLPCSTNITENDLKTVAHAVMTILFRI